MYGGKTGKSKFKITPTKKLYAQLLNTSMQYFLQRHWGILCSICRSAHLSELPAIHCRTKTLRPLRSHLSSVTGWPQISCFDVIFFVKFFFYVKYWLGEYIFKCFEMFIAFFHIQKYIMFGVIYFYIFKSWKENLHSHSHSPPFLLWNKNVH